MTPMIRVSEAVKARLDRYVATRQVVLDEKYTADEAVNKLLDLAEADLQAEIGMKGMRFDELTRMYVGVMAEKRYNMRNAEGLPW